MKRTKRINRDVWVTAACVAAFAIFLCLPFDDQGSPVVQTATTEQP